MYAAVIRASQKWRGIEVTLFKAKQLTAIRKELDDAHQQRHASPFKPATEKSPAHFSSRNRT